MVDAFGSSRINLKPPERGVFSLDHDHECRPEMTTYLSCLKENCSDHLNCRILAKKFLECRMTRGLMDPDDFKNLGYDNNLSNNNTELRSKITDNEMNKESTGFISGTGVKTKNKWKFW